MVAANERKILGNLVDVDRGIVSREIFTSEELYQQQLERIFARAWLFVGHDVADPQPERLLRLAHGRRVRDPDARPSGRSPRPAQHLPPPRHEGLPLRRGQRAVFSCPYHGWSYSTDGKLVSVPGRADRRAPVPDRLSRRAQEGRVGPDLRAEDAHLQGLSLGLLGQGCPGLGRLRRRHEAVPGRLPRWRGWRTGDVEVIGGVQKFIIPSSWMYGAENFIGDAYHGISHRSVDLAGISPQSEGRHTRGGTSASVLGPIAFPEAWPWHDRRQPRDDRR